MKDRIKQIRLEKGLTQADFGERIGVSQNYIWMLETGKRDASRRAIRDICREFGVSEIWLRTGEGEMCPADTRAEELGRSIRELFADQTDSFRTRLLTALLRFDPEGPEWEILERIFDEVAGEQKKP